MADEEPSSRPAIDPKVLSGISKQNPALVDRDESLQSTAASTPASERSEDDEGMIQGRTTVTTELLRNRSDEVDRIKKESVTFTHQGARGISHQLDKDGVVHLRPKTSRKASKVRTLVSFRARESHFDRHNKEAAKDPFRGFYTLFWISLSIMMLNTFYHSFDRTGQIISLTFATLFSRDAIVLALSDGVMVASLFVCIPFAKVLAHGWFRYWPTLIWFQHAWQACLLAAVIKWARYRDWPWVQSGFFVLHTLSMMMKIHSYMAINGFMADNYYRMKRLEDMVEERVAEVEGSRDGEKVVGRGGVTEQAWQRAIDKARAAEEREKVDAQSSFASSSAVEDEEPSRWDSLPAQRGTSILRQRANASVVERRPSVSQTESIPKPQKEPPASQTVIRDPHPLATHPDKVISDLAREVELIREELTSSSPASDQLASPEVHTKTVTWPSNITLANFWDYLLVPTLVYELSYPRTKAVRPLYLLEKFLATFGTFFVIYVITEHWIMPRQPDPSTPLLRTFLELAVPMILNVSTKKRIITLIYKAFLFLLSSSSSSSAYSTF